MGFIADECAIINMDNLYGVFKVDCRESISLALLYPHGYTTVDYKENKNGRDEMFDRIKSVLVKELDGSKGTSVL